MIFWIPLAHAQQEACSPYPTDRLRAEVGAAEQALLALQVPRAASLLDEVVRQGRCLDDVVLPADLGRLARVQALRHFYEQDPEQLAGWAQLALAVDPEGRWPVDDDHPVRRFLDPDLVPSRSGPADVWVSHPRRGGVFLDGAWLATPEAATGSPHLVQVFDGNGTRVDGWWQDGAAFPDAALAAAPTEDAPPRWWLREAAEVDAPDPLRSWGPARRDTARAYASYLDKNPTGEHAAEARRRLDDKEWEAATQLGTVDAARGYLERWPRGRNVEKAERVLEGEAFRIALAQGSRDALILFRGRYPRGAYAAEASRRLDDLAWADATRADTADAYAKYRFHWPRGQHAQPARLAQEELDWTAAVQAGSEAALVGFVEAWPHGNHTALARLRLDGLRFWRVDVWVEGEGAGAVASALSRHVRNQGFEVALLPAGSSADLKAGSALLHVRITNVVGPQGLVGRLELRGRGLSAPLASLELKAARADQLGTWLADALPPLGQWRTVAPD